MSKQNTATLSTEQRESIPELIKNLASREGLKRQAARFALADMGEPVVDFLAELVEHPKHIYRWECLKTLVQIADPNSVELFLLALEDEDFDVRWLAAEGLIKLGPSSAVPMLEYLMANMTSDAVRDGARHVLKALRHKLKAKKELDELLTTLQHTTDAGSISMRSYALLRRLQS
ncbi:MAG: HEAT repeat domain-containing protein [Bacteroidetes bacterium]|nr:HEAT repeat domain-containing protein [Bacteroidota bacterium]